MTGSNADRIFEAILALPPKERLRLVERVVHQLAESSAAAEAPGAVSIVGLFGDEPELIDEVVEDAMRARERDPLRRFDG